METPQSTVISRSRGKHAGESSLTTKMRQRRKMNGQARLSDESESDAEEEPGTVVLHKLCERKIVLLPDGTVVKSGKRIAIGEADALKTAASAGVPVPGVLDAQILNGRVEIRMEYVPGQSLDKVWPTMSADDKKDIAQQLGVILTKMRSATAPSSYIGACSGSGVRDTRQYSTYVSPACQDEASFNEYLISSLLDQTPQVIRDAFSRRLKTNHDIVLTHCDLHPRNIMVENGRIQGIVDWEDGGWYPAYWEYIKFVQKPSTTDWRDYAKYIFPTMYQDELVDMIAIIRWQMP